MPLSHQTSLRARLLGCLVVAFMTGCARPAVPVARTLPTPTLVERLPGGTTLALPRPTPGAVWLSLWLSAGSRDARPAQLATAAGWLLAERAGAHGRIEPEATELTLLCDVRPKQGLKACVERVGLALSRSDVSEADALKLRERLRTTRLRALTDEARVAEQTAIAGLLGEAASGFMPLGDAALDAQVTASALSTFIREHLRTDQALLIGAGDVRDAELEAAYARFRPKPQPALPGPRTTPPLHTQVRVDEGRSPSLTFALAASDPVLAASVGERMHILYAGATARVARLSGFALLTVRMPAGREPFVRLQRAAFDLRRLTMELSYAHVVPREDALESLTREIGEQWIHRRDPALSVAPPWPMSVVVTLAPEVAAKPDNELNARRSRQEEAAKRAIAAGESNALGPIDGKIDDARASVKVPNGVGIEVTARPGDRWLSAVIRLDQGASEDPQTRHGRAALLATWLSDGCGFAEAQALDAHLRAIDGRLTPLVSADATGVRIVAPKEHWERALDTLLRCAVRPSYASRSIEDARARLLSSLLGQERALYSAFAAQTLAPATPGFVASWGTPRGVSSVAAAELRRLHKQLVQGSHVSIAIAVDAEPERVARFAARRVAQLTQAETLPHSQVAPETDRLVGEQGNVDALRAVVGLRVDGDARGQRAPALVARELSLLLSQRLGQARWHDGQGSADLSFSALSLALTETELPQLEAVVQAALRELDQRSDQRWQALLRNLELEEDLRNSGAAGWAQTAFLGGARPSPESELTSLRRLLRARPHFAVLRPKS